MSNLEKIKWLDLSQAGLFLDVRAVGQDERQLLLLDMKSKLDPERLANLGFTAMTFEDHPHFNGHLYQYHVNESLSPRVINEELGVPLEYIRQIQVTRDEIKQTFNENSRKLLPQRLDVLLNSATPLGYNSDGNQVFSSSHNRFYVNMQGSRIVEGPDDLPSPVYLRASKYKDLKECLKGYLHDIECENKNGTHNDFVKFLALITQKKNHDVDVEKVTPQQIAMAEEAFETVLLDRLGNLEMDQEGFNTALKIYNNQPTKTVRNNTIRMLQQYSTPIALSLVAQRLLVHGDNTTKQKYSVLEPTIGNGSLISMLVRDPNASVFGNELDAKRADRARSLTSNFECTVVTADAMEVNFSTLFNESVDYVISNPPFGSMHKMKEVGQIRVNQLRGVDREPRLVSPEEDMHFSTDKLDHAIIIRALNARKDVGRSVFIFGADKLISDGTVENKSKYFMNYLHDHYNVEGTVELNGGMYSRNGANMNIRMMVVGNRKDDYDLLADYKLDAAPKQLQVIHDYEDLWAWSENVIYNRLNPQKDQILSQSVEQKHVYIKAPAPVAEKVEDKQPVIEENILAQLDDVEHRPTTLEGVASSFEAKQTSAVDNFNDVGVGQPSSAVDLFNVDVEKTQAAIEEVVPAEPVVEVNAPAAEESPSVPKFGRKAKTKKSVNTFDSGTSVETTEMSTGTDDYNPELQKAPDMTDPTSEEALAEVLKEDPKPAEVEDVTSESTKTEEATAVITPPTPEDIPLATDSVTPVAPEVASEEKVQPIRKVSESDSTEPKEENYYQVKYVPLSRATAPIAMVPKNQIKAINQANISLLNYIDDFKNRSLGFAKMVNDGQYPTSVDAFVANKLKYANMDALSDAYACEQVDAVAHMIMRFESNSPVLVGDQTGLGKGRVAAATLRFAAINGTTPVFLTDTTQLLNDIWRDIEATDSAKYFNKPFIFNTDAVIYRFGTEEVLHKGEALPADMEVIPAQHDLILGTYSQFNRPNRKRALLTQHLNQSTMIVLDESHRSAAMKSQTSQFFLDALEKTNLINFQSATGIKRPENLEFYHKLFPHSVSRNDLVKVVENADGPILEFISEGLVEGSAMIRREQDLSHVTMSTYVPQEEEIVRYHQYSDALSDILASMVKFSKDIRMDALENIVSDSAAQSTLSIEHNSDDEKNRLQLTVMNFGSRMYQIQKQFLLALKTESTSDAAINSLKNGQKPVIALENTGESLFNILIQERMAKLLDKASGKNSKDEDELVIDEQKFQSFKSIIAEIEFIEGELQLAMNPENTANEVNSKRIKDQQKQLSKLESQRNMFITDHVSDMDKPPQFRDLLNIMLDRIDVVTATDNYGNKFTKKLSDEIKYDENGNEIINPYVEMIKILRNKINDYPELPLMPLDVLRNNITKAGFTIDEISGRGIYLTETNGKWKINKQNNNNAEAKIQKTAMFQSGELDALIITRSGSTGISLHAAKNPNPDLPSDHLRQRILYFLQKPENATDTMQMIGRVGRRGEVSHPLMTTMDSGIPSETRMHLMMMRKLSTLSANVSANAETKYNENDFPDMLNSIGNRVALDYLRNNINLASILDIKITDDDLHRNSVNYHVNQLLSKLVLVPISQQEIIYQDLVGDYQEKVRELDLLGRNPLKTNFLDWKATVTNKFAVQDNFFSSIQKNEHELNVNAFDLPVEFNKLKYIDHVEPLRTDNLNLMFKESDDFLLKKVQRINPAISDPVNGFGHYIRHYEAMFFDKYEDFALQKLCEPRGKFRNEGYEKQRESILEHFGMNPMAKLRRDDMFFRDPNDYSKEAQMKIAEGVYLANDETLSSNFDRMAQLIREMKHIHKSFEENVEKGLAAHGLIFNVRKPSLFDDEVPPSQASGALMRLELPDLRPSAITPNAVKLDIVYPGEKQIYKVPLLRYSAAMAEDEFIKNSVPISEEGRKFISQATFKTFVSNTRQVDVRMSARNAATNLFDRFVICSEKRKEFDSAQSGDVVREAVALTGNMFKAHKLVSTLDVHHSTVIFTDNEGMRNRALLLPLNTSSQMFSQDMKNNISFQQLKTIGNYLANISSEPKTLSNKHTTLAFDMPFKKSNIHAVFNGTDFVFRVQSVGRQFNKLMNNTNLFYDPRNSQNPNSLNIHYTEVDRNNFKFVVSGKDIVKAIEEIELSTKVESIKLDIEKVSPEGKALFYKDISRLLDVKPEKAVLNPPQKEIPQEIVSSSAAEMKKMSKETQTLDMFS